MRSSYHHIVGSIMCSTSCLKKALRQHITVSRDLPPLDEEGKLTLVPDEILEVKEKIEEKGDSRVLGELERSTHRGHGLGG